MRAFSCFAGGRSGRQIVSGNPVAAVNGNALELPASAHSRRTMFPRSNNGLVSNSNGTTPAVLDPANLSAPKKVSTKIDLPTISLGGRRLIGLRERPSGLRTLAGSIDRQVVQIVNLHRMAKRHPAVDQDGKFSLPPVLEQENGIPMRVFLARTQQAIAAHTLTLDVTFDPENSGTSLAKGVIVLKGKERAVPLTLLVQLVQAHEERVLDQARQIQRAPTDDRQGKCCAVLEFMGFEPKQAMDIAKALIANYAGGATPPWVSDLNAAIDKRLNAYRSICEIADRKQGNAIEAVSLRERPIELKNFLASITNPDDDHRKLIDRKYWEPVKPVTNSYITMTLANLKTYRFIHQIPLDPRAGGDKFSGAKR